MSLCLWDFHHIVANLHRGPNRRFVVQDGYPDVMTEKQATRLAGSACKWLEKTGQGNYRDPARGLEIYYVQVVVTETGAELPVGSNMRQQLGCGRLAEHVDRAIAEHQPVFGATEPLFHMIRDIVDWLIEVKNANPKLYGKAAERMSFEQVKFHSDRWHEKLAAAADEAEDEDDVLSGTMGAISSTETNAPTVYQHAGQWEGWRWVWLMTKTARQYEGGVMGHCVGGFSYDNLREGEYIFSLRDPAGNSHVTSHVFFQPGTFAPWREVQTVSKGNSKIPERYRPLLQDAMNVVWTRVFITGDPVAILKPGRTELKYGGAVWIEDGRIHRKDGPAVISRTGEYWFDSGVMTRPDDEPAATILDAKGIVRQEWWVDGKRHRNGNPAIIRRDTDGIYRNDLEFDEWLDLEGTIFEYWYRGVKVPANSVNVTTVLKINVTQRRFPYEAL